MKGEAALSKAKTSPAVCSKGLQQVSDVMQGPVMQDVLQNSHDP